MTDIPGGTEQSGSGRFCHNCAATNPAEFNFCPRCGARINFLRPLPAPAAGPYPVRFDVEYPQKLSRLATLARLILAIPQFLIISALGFVVGVVTLIAWVAILFTRRYPKGLFELVVGLNRWTSNVYAYTLLLRDEYPPFSTDPVRYPVRYEVDYPERLSRWLIFVKFFPFPIMVFAHQFVLGLLWIVGFFFSLISWFAILFTGRFPRGLFSFISGLLRWNLRVTAYGGLLTDAFPPFSKRADARPGSGRAVAIAAVAGSVILAGNIAAFVAFTTIDPQTEEVQVSYGDLLSGRPSIAADVEGNLVTLLSAEDPALETRVRSPRQGRRFVRFRVEVFNYDALFSSVSEQTFRLKDTSNDNHDPLFVATSPATLSGSVSEGDTVVAFVLFEVRNNADPAELTYSPGFAAFFPFGERVRFKFTGEAGGRPIASPDFGEEVAVSYEDLLSGRPSRPVEIDGTEVILLDARDPDQPTGPRFIRFNLKHHRRA